MSTKQHGKNLTQTEKKQKENKAIVKKKKSHLILKAAIRSCYTRFLLAIGCCMESFLSCFSHQPLLLCLPFPPLTPLLKNIQNHLRHAPVISPNDFYDTEYIGMNHQCPRWITVSAKLRQHPCSGLMTLADIINGFHILLNGGRIFLCTMIPLATD